MSHGYTGLRAATAALLGFVCSTFLAQAPATAGAAATTDPNPIVVNEFSANRYVELRNVSDSTVDIGGFPLWLCGPDGVAGDPRIASGAELEPGGFWVIASRSFTGGRADQMYFGTFPGGGAALLHLDHAWADGVAVAGDSPCGEGDPAPPCPSGSTARDTASTDTGRNAVDFSCRTESPGEVN